MTRDELIAKLNAATAGSRELNCAVWVAVNGKGQPMREIGPPTYAGPRWFCNPNPEIEWIGYDLLYVSPRYTFSLDDALSLARTADEQYHMLKDAYSAHVKTWLDIDGLGPPASLFPAIRAALLVRIKPEPPKEK